MKFMNLKRFASIAMAGVMTLSLAVPAFAADADTPKGQVVISGIYEEVPISVSVPATGAAQINPYGLPVKIPYGEGKNAELVGQQITTKPLSIRNQGTTSLDVDATLAVVPSGGVSIKGGDLGGSDDGKQINVVLEVANANDDTLAVSSTSDKLEDLVTVKFADDATWTNAQTLVAPAAAKDGTPTAPAAGTGLTVLGAVTAKTEGFTYAKNSIALFRLTGELNEAPVNGSADDPWTDEDGFEATVVFKFKPHAFVEPTATLDNSTLNTTTTSVAPTLKVTYNPGDSDLTVKSYAWSSDNTGVVATTGPTSTTDTLTLTVAGAGTANVKCTLTLSDDTTVVVSDECAVTVTVGS